MDTTQTLPYIQLTTPEGQIKFLPDYRCLANLVIVFAGENTHAVLHAMAQHPRQFHNADSQVLVITPETSEMPETPFTVLIDDTGQAANYAQPGLCRHCRSLWGNHYALCR